MFWTKQNRKKFVARAEAKRSIKDLAGKFSEDPSKRERLAERILAIKAARFDTEVSNIRRACSEHFPALQKNLRRQVVYDDYGGLIQDTRHEEAARFISSLQLSTSTIGKDQAIQQVLTAIEELEVDCQTEGFCPSSFPEDGHEFEYWVAEALRKFGWEATVTKGSGDQGIDVVAKQGSYSIGIQCKRYSGTVGNKAVQEAYSGRKYFDLNVAGVLTNALFTKSAKELAEATGVLLISPEDIPNLFDRLHKN